MIGRGFRIGAHAINLAPFCRLCRIIKQRSREVCDRGARDAGPPGGNQRACCARAGSRGDGRAGGPVHGKEVVARDVGPPGGK